MNIISVADGWSHRAEPICERYEGNEVWKLKSFLYDLVAKNEIICFSPKHQVARGEDGQRFCYFTCSYMGTGEEAGKKFSCNYGIEIP